MSAQPLTNQHADHFVARADPHLETVIVDLSKQAFGQSKAEGLLGHRFVFHITDIIDVTCGDGIIIADITDTVNGDADQKDAP